MEKYDLSEPEAFSFIQRRAMDTRSRMSVVAQGIIDGEIVPEAEDSAQ